MNRYQVRLLGVVISIGGLSFGGYAFADRGDSKDSGANKGDANHAKQGIPEYEPLTLRPVSFQDSERQDMTVTESGSESWEIDGPISLRSADPEPPGAFVIKNIFGWSTSSGEDDDYEYELELEWGVVENHELIFEVPFELGDGRIDGNGDISLGWHWRLWEEQGALPAFAIRNYIRVPSGVDSSGVDYEFRGLITKTIVADSMRLHLNPFLSSINGNNEEDARHFRWGAVFGTDCKLSDDVLLIADYIYANGELEDTRDTHSAELGVDWKLDEHQKIGFATEIGLDGDSYGPNFGASISYILSFGG